MPTPALPGACMPLYQSKSIPHRRICKHCQWHRASFQPRGQQWSALDPVCIDSKHRFATLGLPLSPVGLISFNRLFSRCSNRLISFPALGWIPLPWMALIGIGSPAPTGKSRRACLSQLHVVRPYCGYHRRFPQPPQANRYLPVAAIKPSRTSTTKNDGVGLRYGASTCVFTFLPAPCPVVAPTRLYRLEVTRRLSISTSANMRSRVVPAYLR